MDQKQALVDRLKQANNILVTVSNNPSVDQLASCIGLTIALNKMDKHATAVFSGAVPSTIEFLQPEETIEKNTDSLRDFIIALDKAKADKLRYKVEDKVVKIFITPYRTSICVKDLQFWQGDFNVAVVLALGVHSQADLDQAITSHGRILHDATVATVNVKAGGELGSINWLDTRASSLSELATELIEALDKQQLDNQIATAFLTGIVAETQRFSNDKTSPTTMTISAELMGAGANQQLVATKLEPPKPVTPPPAPAPQEVHHDDGTPPPHDADQPPAAPPKPDDGTLEISHLDDKPPEPQITPEPAEEQHEPEPTPQIHIDEQGSLHSLQDALTPAAGPPPAPGNTDPNRHMQEQHMILEPPVTGGSAAGASSQGEGFNSDAEDEERPAGEPTPMPGQHTEPTGILERSPHLAPTAAASQFAPPNPFAPFAQQPQAGELSEPDDLAPPNPFQRDAPPSIVASPFAPDAPIAPTPLVQPQPTVIAPTAPPPAPVLMPESQQPAAPIVMPASPVITPTLTPPPAFPPAVPSAPVGDTQTLSQIETNVNSPHLQLATDPSVFSPQPAPSPASFIPAPAPVSTPSMSLPPTPAVPPAPDPYAPLQPSVPIPPASPPAPQDSASAAPSVDAAREAVMKAMEANADQPPERIEALNAFPLGDPLHGPGFQPAPQGGTPPPATPPPMMPPAQ